MAGSLTLRVITPDRIVLDQVVDTAVFPAVDGLVGVLPRHVQMVAALGPGELRYGASGGTGRSEHCFVSGGFAEVHDDTLRIITEASELPSEIDVVRADQVMGIPYTWIDVVRAEAAAERARDRIEARPGDESGPLDVLRARASLRRALGRIKLAQHS